MVFRGEVYGFLLPGEGCFDACTSIFGILMYAEVSSVMAYLI